MKKQLIGLSCLVLGASTSLFAQEAKVVPATPTTPAKEVTPAAVVTPAEVKAPAGADAYEKQLDAVMDLFKDFNKTLVDVKDEASAKKAVPALKDVSSKMKALQTEMTKMPNPSAEVEAYISKKYEPILTKEMMDFMGNMIRLQQNKLDIPEIQEALAIITAPAAGAPEAAPEVTPAIPAKEVAPAAPESK